MKFLSSIVSITLPAISLKMSSISYSIYGNLLLHLLDFTLKHRSDVSRAGFVQNSVGLTRDAQVCRLRGRHTIWGPDDLIQ
jgi:hypothetical protein